MIRVNKYTLKESENLVNFRNESWITFVESRDKGSIDIYVEEDDEQELIPSIIHIIETGQQAEDHWLHTYSVRVPCVGVRHLYWEDL